MRRAARIRETVIDPCEATASVYHLSLVPAADAEPLAAARRKDLPLISRAALWVSELRRGEALGPIDLVVCARSGSLVERIWSATWTPGEWDDAGLVCDVPLPLCEAVEIHGKMHNGDTAVQLVLAVSLERDSSPGAWAGSLTSALESLVERP